MGLVELEDWEDWEDWKGLLSEAVGLFILFLIWIAICFLFWVVPKIWQEEEWPKRPFSIWNVIILFFLGGALVASLLLERMLGVISWGWI